MEGDHQFTKFGLFLWKADNYMKGNVLNLKKNIIGPIKGKYDVGDEVLAKCPGYGRQEGIIALIGDSEEKGNMRMLLGNSEKFVKLLKDLGKFEENQHQETMSDQTEKRKQDFDDEEETELCITSKKKKHQDSEVERRRKSIARQKRLEAAATDLELTELSEQLDRSQDLVCSSNTATASLIRDSLQLTIEQPQEHFVNIPAEDTMCRHCEHFQVLQKEVSHLGLRNMTLESKVTHLENNLSMLWNWTRQLQHELQSVTTEKQQFGTRGESVAETPEQQNNTADQRESSEEDMQQERGVQIVGGYTMDQLEWKISHLGSFSKCAKMLFRTLFKEEEYVGKTLTGALGKPCVDKEKLAVVYNLTQKKFPGVSTTHIRQSLCDIVKPSRAIKKQC